MEKKEFIAAVQSKISEKGYFYKHMDMNSTYPIESLFGELGLKYDSTLKTYDNLWHCIKKMNIGKDEFCVTSLFAEDLSKDWLVFYKQEYAPDVLKEFEEYLDRLKKRLLFMANLVLS